MAETAKAFRFEIGDPVIVATVRPDVNPSGTLAAYDNKGLLVKGSAVDNWIPWSAVVALESGYR